MGIGREFVSVALALALLQKEFLAADCGPVSAQTILERLVERTSSFAWCSPARSKLFGDCEIVSDARAHTVAHAQASPFALNFVS